ncbi:MAG: hypothetical protein ACOY37_08025 [Pseudomonadota bacterium]
MLHQTITVAAGVGLSAVALGPVLEPVLLIATTVAGCALLHEYVVRRVRWLRPLFGMSPLRKVPAPSRGLQDAQAHRVPLR